MWRMDGCQNDRRVDGSEWIDGRDEWMIWMGDIYGFT